LRQLKQNIRSQNFKNIGKVETTVAPADNTLHKLVLKWNMKTHPIVWQMPQIWQGLCEKVREQKHYKIYVFRKPTRRTSNQSLFVLLPSHSTCFGCLPHPSSGVL